MDQISIIFFKEPVASLDWTVAQPNIGLAMKACLAVTGLAGIAEGLDGM